MPVPSANRNTDVDIYRFLKAMNTIIALIFFYSLAQVFVNGQSQMHIVVGFISMTYLFGFGAVALLYRNLEPSCDENELKNALNYQNPMKFSDRSSEVGFWESKFGQYYDKTQAMDLSDTAIASRIKTPSYNFVTREKDSISEIDRELMFTDLLVVASRNEIGISTGNKEWTLAHYDPKGDITVETVVVKGTQWNCYRVSGLLEATPMQAASVVLNDDRIGEYDLMFDRIEFLEKLDDRSRIRHSFYKPVWPTAARDFVIMTTWEQLEDGRVLVATRSVQHPLHPPQDNYVRARVLIAGYVFTPAQSKDGNLITFCDVIIHTDVSCDWIPPALLNPFSNTKPVGYFSLLQQICRQEFSPTPIHS